MLDGDWEERVEVALVQPSVVRWLEAEVRPAQEVKEAHEAARMGGRWEEAGLFAQVVPEQQYYSGLEGEGGPLVSAYLFQAKVDGWMVPALEARAGAWEEPLEARVVQRVGVEEQQAGLLVAEGAH